MKQNEKVLYAKDSKKAIRIWSIWSEENNIFMEYGTDGGDLILDSEVVPMGLATRTLQEQILSRINSRINKKLDQGYVFTIGEARNDVRTNALGYKRQTKCKPWNKLKNFPFGFVFCQTKLDGHHCTIINDDGKYIAYSSNGKIIDTIPEILSSIEIPNGRLIEGELYHHGTILQTISSWVRRRQENTKLLKFIVYETDLPNVDYEERLEFMKNLKIIDKKFVEIHKTNILVGNFNVLPIIKAEVRNGYEGLILRPKGFEYESFKRTNACVKVKPIHFKNEFSLDDEFLVVDILSSKDNWARLKCDNGKGKTFMVSAPGTIEEKTEVLLNKKKYIHKHIEVEFAGFTKSKLPQHPVAIRFRQKHEE